MTKPSKITAADVEPRSGSNYPAVYVSAVKGRSKRILGDRFGLKQFGVNLTTLEPGAWSAHRHWHLEEDEFVYVVDGELILIDNNGEHVLKPGDCAGFKSGDANGHHLVNRSSQPATYVEVGTRYGTESVEYPDIDMKAKKVDGTYIMTRKDGSSF